MDINELLESLEKRRTVIRDYTDDALIKVINKIVELEKRIKEIEENK